MLCVRPSTYSCSNWIDGKVDIDTALQVLAGWVTGLEVGGDLLRPQLRKGLPLSTLKGCQHLSQSAIRVGLVGGGRCAIAGLLFTFFLEGSQCVVVPFQREVLQEGKW